MAKDIKKINILTQLQVGAVQYWQRPSSRQMEMRGYSTGDDYTQYTYTMPVDSAAAYVSGEMAKGDTVLSDKQEHTMVQITATTMAGGIMQVDTRL